jgi:anti-sigma regulatory factor (Ser/Thr protein kinase)/anti-anti-sigma regulatory factor
MQHRTARCPIDGPGIADVRAAVRSWFRPEQVDPAALVELDQMVTELCDNVVEHAYHHLAGPLALELSLADDVQPAQAADQGRWRPPPAPGGGRGLGLAIVAQLATAVTIDRTPVGTTLTVRFQPWKQSHATALRPPAPAPELFNVYLRMGAAGSTLTVRGPVNARTLDELDAHLALCTTPGAPSLVVELDDVTVLSSLATQRFRHHRDRALAAGVEVTFACRPGSVAQHVLVLAGIPPCRRRPPSADLVPSLRSGALRLQVGHEAFSGRDHDGPQGAGAVHLGPDALHVITRRVRADGQHAGDGLGVVTVGEQGQHLELAPREPPRRRQRDRIRPSHGVGQRLPLQRRAELVELNGLRQDHDAGAPQLPPPSGQRLGDVCHHPDRRVAGLERAQPSLHGQVEAEPSDGDGVDLAAVLAELRRADGAKLRRGPERCGERIAHEAIAPHHRDDGLLGAWDSCPPAEHAHRSLAPGGRGEPP